MRAAGGLTALASPRRIQIQRVVPPAQRGAEGGSARLVVDVAAESGAPAVPLVNGDVVRVDRIAERVRNRLTVVGNVWTPGPQGFRTGMRLSDALRGAGGVKPDTYLGRVLVARLQPDSTRVQLRAMLRDTTGAVLQDLELREDDEIQVFSATAFRPERYVAIAGAVRKGGRFRYREGMTLRDLTLLAGGLEESALLTEAEVARLPETRANGVTARTVRVGLDSTYIAESAPAGAPRHRRASPRRRAALPRWCSQPYDQVLILRHPTSCCSARCSGRRGEVPGSLRAPDEERAPERRHRRPDGPTTKADANGVEFFRSRERQGRVGVDLRSVCANPRSRRTSCWSTATPSSSRRRCSSCRRRRRGERVDVVPYVRGASLTTTCRPRAGVARGRPGARLRHAADGKVQASSDVGSRRTTSRTLPGARVFVPARPLNATSDNAIQTLMTVAQITRPSATIFTASR